MKDMSNDEIRILINEALSFGYHTAKDEAKGIPSSGYGTRFFDMHNLEQKLDIASVSGSVCPKCGSKEVLWSCYCNECQEVM